MTFRLKEGLRLGVASAATQIEGGDCNHNWNDWYKRGKIADGSNPERANDHYRLYKEDGELMADMGIRNYRMGIEWARLIPSPGVIDEQAVEHYRDEMEHLKEKGMELLLTIHHFTNPMWFEKLGGFEKEENITYFLDLVELVVERFGDLVSEYITINEPNVYAVNSYFFGEWPPGEKSLTRTMKVMGNMAACHILAYEKIHDIRGRMGFKDTKVSFAAHVRIFEPQNPINPWHRLCTALSRRFFQGALNEAMCLGIGAWPLNKVCSVAPGQYADFIAINYYTRTAVSGLKDGTREGASKNDLGWDIYPEGIVEVSRELCSLLPGRPVYITENGTCDNEDRFRCLYIYEHLKALCQSELPVKRYYHWCFCDNFEWVEGESARFGLVKVDYETQARTVKRSGQFYSAIIRDSGVTEKSFEEYVKPQKYHQ